MLKTSTPQTLTFGARDVQAALSCSRWKIWNLERTDPEFPAARDVGGMKRWLASEIIAYLESRPRRVYRDEAEGADSQ